MALLRSQPGVVAVTDNVARGGCWRPPTGILLLNEPRVESLNCWEGREAIQQLQQQQQESEEKKSKAMQPDTSERLLLVIQLT